MSRIYNDVTELMGKTPLIHFKRLEDKFGLKATILAKVECFNPAGSVKDRVGKMIIEEAENISATSKEYNWLYKIFLNNKNEADDLITEEEYEEFVEKNL